MVASEGVVSAPMTTAHLGVRPPVPGAPPTDSARGCTSGRDGPGATAQRNAKQPSRKWMNYDLAVKLLRASVVES